MNAKIEPEKIVNEIRKTLIIYDSRFQKGLKSIIDNESENLKSELKETSPRRKKVSKKRRKTTQVTTKSKHRVGSYARSWTCKVTHNTFSYYEKTVYNRSYANLTHLLEHGHRIKGTHFETEPILHIAPARTKIGFQYLRETNKLINRLTIKSQ